MPDRIGWTSRIPLDGDPKVSMVIGCYKSGEEILTPISSFLCQTHQNFENIVVHDGPGGDEVHKAISIFGDDRIIFTELPENHNDGGNTCKEYGSQLATGDFIGHSNDDNYYAPVYFEWLVSEMLKNDAPFGYCNMVHSFTAWHAFECHPRPFAIDGGGWICRADIVKSTPWPVDKKEGCSDGRYAEALAANAGMVVKIDALLFVHN